MRYYRIDGARQEVLYADFLAANKKDHAGYTKVIDACRLAKSHAHEWIWVGTRFGLWLD